MTLATRILATGPGWFVQDAVCGAGPDDRPFEERHETVCLSTVLEGTFGYRTRTGEALLLPGALMLGNAEDCFECSHHHSAGDRCLSFHYTPDCWVALVAALPGARQARLPVPRLPPRVCPVTLTATLEAARDVDSAALEEGALDLAAAVLRALDDHIEPTGRGTSGRERDSARVSQIVRHIELNLDEVEGSALSVGALAREAGMSPYHFLRTFRRVAGMPPHQFVLRLRLNRAAIRLRTTQEPISAIALDAGFADLSTFNRRFRRIMGVTPGAYRKSLG